MTEASDPGADRVAVLLLALLPSDRELVGHVLGSFAADELSRITNAATRLGPVAPGELVSQIDSFLGAFAEGPRISGGVEQGQCLVSAVKIIEAESDPGPIAEAPEEDATVWQKCAQVPIDSLLQWMLAEPAYIRAAWLALLAPSCASELLSRFAPYEAGEIVALLPKLSPCSPGMLAALEAHIQKELESFGQANSGARERVVDLVARMNPAEFKQLIASLADRDPELARELQESMYDFEDFPALDIDSRRRVVERLSPDVISQSLLGAEPEVAEAFLSVLGSRTRRMIEQEIRSTGKIDAAVVAAGRQAAVTVIVQLLKEGAIARPSTAETRE